MTDNQRENGFQITKEVLAKAVANDKHCNVADVVIESFTKTEGSNKGEGFTCVLFAVDVKAKVHGQEEEFQYMAKCMPANEFRAKMLLEMKGFRRECYVYDELMKSFQETRKAFGLRKIRIPTVHLCDNELGIIVMDNLKPRGLILLNRIQGEEMSVDLTKQVLEEIAMFHATGYHFLQAHEHGVEGFAKKCPDFFFPGWIANNDDIEANKRFEEMFQGMIQGILAIVRTYGEDQALVERLNQFVPNMMEAINDKTSAKESHKFKTLVHNDLHMSNVMYRKLDDQGSCEDVTLLDLQLMKYARPTVDLAYFFGSSTYFKFREEHLQDLLQFYHQKLTAELAVLGYKDIYSLEELIADFDDTWVFGFSVSCLHIQVCNMNFDGPDGFDPEMMGNDEEQTKQLEKMAQFQLISAGKNKPFLEKVFGMVQEAADRNII